MDDLPQHAGMNTEEVPVFRSQIDEALRSGRALLLVDGLDEISDEGARTTFAGHLGTFLAMFPQAAMVVTSREAGYRHVAGVIASACRHVRLAPFDEPDVGRLCESWHVEVVGDTDRVRSDARLPDTPPEPDVIRSLFRLWREADSSELCRFAAWAFGTQPLLSRDAFAPDAWGDCDTWFERTAAKDDRNAPLVLAWYRRSSWSDAELAEKLRNSDPSYRPTAREMLATLGEAGRRVLEKWDAENAQLYCPNGVPMARSTSTKRNFSSSGIYFAFDECPDCRRSAVASPGDGYARCYKERKARELVLCPVKKLGFR